MPAFFQLVNTVERSNLIGLKKRLGDVMIWIGFILTVDDVAFENIVQQKKIFLGNYRKFANA